MTSFSDHPGENTINLHKLVNQEGSRLLPKAKQAIIPGDGQNSPRENSQASIEAYQTLINE